MKPKARISLSNERLRAILKDAQFMAIVAQLIENRYQYNMFDANLRNPVYRNSARQIMQATSRIKRELGLKFKLVKQEELEFEVSDELDRVISFFMMLPADIIDEIMTDLETHFTSLKGAQNASNG